MGPFALRSTNLHPAASVPGTLPAQCLDGPLTQTRFVLYSVRNESAGGVSGLGSSLDGPPTDGVVMTNPGPFPVLICSICQKRVHVETSNTDESGNAVHEECYVSRLMERETKDQPAFSNRTILGPDRST